MRIVAFVSGGPVALRALEALAAVHQLVLVVRPQRGRHTLQVWRDAVAHGAQALGLVPADPIIAWSRRAGVPLLWARPGDDDAVAARIRSAAPDFGCIATYPQRIPDAVLAACGHECLNVHPSLLPRHRGANPLFWTYHAGDRDGGVTVHVATSRLDAGATLLSESIPIARGESVIAVHGRAAERGAALLAQAVTECAAGKATRRDQDEAAATRAPAPRAGRQYAELATWSSEQAWHFLAGMLERYRDALTDTAGTPVSYSRVEGFEVRDPLHAPGTVLRDGPAWNAWTRDGVVHLSGPAA